MLQHLPPVICKPGLFHRLRCLNRNTSKLLLAGGFNINSTSEQAWRAILGGIYAATLAVFVDDNSEGKAETAAFLDRRIAGIIRFEKAKARFVPPAEQRFSVARFLGRLRYPAR